MSQRPWMPLYIADYRADTAHLSIEQHGAYLLLLMAMWVAGGYLPADPAKLARICNVSLKRWRWIWPDLLPLFATTGTGRITHKRVLRELAKTDAKSTVRAEAGRKGGQAKGQKGRVKLDSESSAPEQANDELPLNSLDLSKQMPSKRDFARAKTAGDSRAPATDTHNQTPEDGKPSILPKAPNGALGHARERQLADDEFRIWYQQYPHKVGKGQARLAFARARKKASLAELVEGVERYRAIKPADQNWRYPATWLNGEGWLDEPAEPPIGRATGPPAGPRNSTEAQDRAEWNRVLDEAAKGKRHG